MGPQRWDPYELRTYYIPTLYLLYIYYLLYAGYIPTIYPPYTSGTPTIYVYPICTLVVPKQSPVKGLRQNFWAPHF